MFRKKGVLLGVCLVFILSAAFIYADEAELQRLRAQGEKEGWTFTVGKTSVSDIPLEQLCGLKIPKKWWKNAPFDGSDQREGLLEVPATFDWRDTGKVTAIRNQGSCGSCWAFGMLGSYESILLVDGQGSQNLSEQFLVRCNSYGYGCNGGWWCYDDMYNGIPMESCYPYTATDGSCSYSCTKYFPVDTWYYVGSSSGVPSTTALKQAIYDHGAIACAVYVNSAFQNYTGGIFNSCTSSSPNHAVVLVGWGDTYWIMRNSWGTGWGESGYMRITFGCSNIGYAASYAIPDNVTPQPPVANFSADPTIVEVGNSVQFTDLSTNSPTSWEWTFAGGTPSSSSNHNPQVTYNTIGTYTVSLTATNSVGSDTETKVDYITVTEAMSEVGNTTVFGSTSTSTYRQAMPFTMPENGTIQSVTMYHTGGGGSMILGVYEGEGLPDNRLGVTATTAVSGSTGWQTIGLTSPAYVDGGLTVWLAWVYESNPGIRYQTGSPVAVKSSDTWSGGMPDPFGSSKELRKYIYSIYASYTPTVCSEPVADFVGSPTIGCAPLTVNFTDQSTNSPTSWLWDFGDSGTSTAQNPPHTYTTPGTYTVILTATNGCGSDTKTKVDYITVECLPPVADFSASPTEIFEGETVTFEDQSTNCPTFWTWDFGDNDTDTGPGPHEKVYDDPGTYTVTLIVVNECGSDSEIKDDCIIVHPGPEETVADFEIPEANRDSYVGDSVMFTDQSTGGPTSWQWTFEGGTPATSTLQNPVVKYETAGTFDVTLVATDDQGSDTKTIVDYITVTDTYCDSSGNSQEDEWIAEVHIDGLLNKTSGASSYSNFTEEIACLQKNKIVSVSLKPGFDRPGYPYPEYWKIWTDYNHDGDFSDSGEEVFSGISPADPDVYLTGNFTNPVPPSAESGYTRIRVSMSYYDWPQVCGTFSNGEVEEYTACIIDEQVSVGNTTIYERTTDSGNRRAMPFTMLESGKIISVTMYHLGGSGKMILGVYDGEVSPQNRLGVTVETEVYGSDGWQEINLESPAYVASGNTVWLAWVYENNPGIVYDSEPDDRSNPPGRYDAGVGWSGGMPEHFGIGTQEDHWYSIYATCIPSACKGQYTLTTNVPGNGTVTLNPPGGTYCEGMVVTLTAVPDPCWQFSNWSGDLSGTENQTTITMDSNKSVTATFVENCTGTATVGNTTVFGSSIFANTRRAMPFTMPENGNICSVSIYHAGGSGGMILGVYGGEGAPQNLLGVTPTTTINSSAGWQTICLTSPAYVAGGETFWLAWVFESNPRIFYQNGSPGRAEPNENKTWEYGMPDPFGSSTQAPYIYSIYANYTVD